MRNIAVIAGHHKGGTVWISGTFRKIAKLLNIPFVNIDVAPVLKAQEWESPLILTSPHSNFRKYPGLLEMPTVSVLHLIRDPRDIVISGMHYHLKSTEAWLLKAREELDSQTYQAKLNGLATDRSRYLFEMAHAGGDTVRAMLRWNYGRKNVLECRYENLIQDVEMTEFTRIVTHLGFLGNELNVCRKTFWKQSIFGGRAQTGERLPHIRSGQTRQWAKTFDKRLGRAFVKEFGDALVRLGYETDNAWVERLPETVSALDEMRDQRSDESGKFDRDMDQVADPGRT